jgi:BirA family transcriptional regulator, biotin operon repressor / biotin---[acetyl-CoA-carboxylase] ligase
VTSHDLRHVRELIAATGSQLGAPLEILDETDSTNEVAKRSARLGAPHGSTWLAEEQRHGKGRQGRSWVGVRGESLLVSVLARVACPAGRLPLLSLATGLAVRDAVAKAGAVVGVKWPNDVVSSGKKLAGILVEALPAVAGRTPVIIGVGLNVHTRSFPAELAGRATSVALLGDGNPDRAQLLADLLANLDRDLELVASRGLGVIHGRLTAVDALLGRPIQTDDGVAGVADGIDLEGRLRLKKSDGSLLRLGAGEVHLT